MNLFRRIAFFFRRKPGMIGTAPSVRPAIPTDPADHAEDFAHRWVNELDLYVAARMEAMGIPRDQIGSSDHERRVEWRAFFPDERDGGGVASGGRLSVDSGVLNPDQLTRDYGLEAGELWAKARLRDRIDAIIVHEESEARSGTHEDALSLAPHTRRAISEKARQILRAMERGWRR